MKRIFLAAAMAAPLFIQAAPVSAATICTQVGDFKCYCSGVGCRKFCKDILVLGGGAGGTGASSGLSGAGGLALAPGGAAATARIAEGMFEGPLSVRTDAFSGRVDAVAVFGSERDVAAGKAELFVPGQDGRPDSKGSVRLKDVRLSDGDVSLSMEAVRSMLDPRIGPLALLTTRRGQPPFLGTRK